MQLMFSCGSAKCFSAILLRFGQKLGTNGHTAGMQILYLYTHIKISQSCKQKNAFCLQKAVFSVCASVSVGQLSRTIFGIMKKGVSDGDA